ncbi:MAG: hypothetical protein ABIO43_03740 [Sphingomicrobium sp.]
MVQPRIVLFGDSHVHAIQEAVRHRVNRRANVPVEVRRLFKEKNGKTLGDTPFDGILEVGASLSSNDVMVSVIGGNQHAVFSTIQHPQPFDFLLPGDDPAELMEGQAVLPYRALYDYFSSGIRGGDAKSIEALRASTQARMIHLAAPPPKGDNSFIENYHDTRFAEENIASLGISPPTLRMKFWRLQNRIIGELCAKIGIELMMPPTEAVDADGFLKAECFANDATHANDNYGELVLQQLELALIGRSRPVKVA